MYTEQAIDENLRTVRPRVLETSETSMLGAHCLYILASQL